MTKKSATSGRDRTRRDAKRRRRAARAAKAAGAAALSAGILLHGGPAIAATTSAEVGLAAVAATVPSDDPGSGSGDDGSGSEGSGGTEKVEDAPGEKTDSPSTEKPEGASSGTESQSAENTESPSTDATGSAKRDGADATTPSEAAHPAASDPPRPPSKKAPGAGPVSPSSILNPGAPTAARRTLATPEPSPAPVDLADNAARTPEPAIPDERHSEVAHAVGALVTGLTRSGMQDTAVRALAATPQPSARAANVEEVTRAVTDSALGRVALALSGVVPGAPLDPAHPGTPPAPTTGLALLQWAFFRRGENPLFNQAPRLSPIQDDPTSGALGGSLGAIDPDGDRLTYDVTRQPTHGTVTVDPTTGAYTYTRDPNLDPALAGAGYTDSFQVTVRDNRPDAPGLGGLTAVLHDALARSRPDLAERLFGAHTTVVTVEVAVPAADQPPPAPPVRTPAERGVVTGNLGFVAPEGATVDVGQPASGTVTVDRAGNYTYVPSAAAQLAAARTPGKDYDTFTVVVREGAPAPQLRGFRLLAAAPAQGGTSYTEQVEIRPADTPAPHVVGTIALGPQPSGLALSPDGRRAIVTDSADNTVRLIDMDTGIATVVHTSTQASEALFTPDGSAIYIVDGAAGTLTVLDGRSGAHLGEIVVGPSTGAVTFGPGGGRAYVTSYGVNGTDGSVTVIDTARHAAIGSPIPVAYPGSVVLSPDGSRAWVVGDDEVVTIDDTGGTTRVVTGVGARPPVFSADGSVAYISSETAITVVDAADGVTIGTIAAGTRPGDVQLSPDGMRGFVTSRDDGTVTVFDTTANGAPHTVDLGGSPRDVVFSPDGRFVLVVRDTDGVVTVLDGDGERVGSDVPVGPNVGAVQFDPAGKHAWIADQSGAVTLVDLATGASAGSVQLGGSPSTLVFSPDGRRVYVNAYRDTGGGTFFILDAADGRTIDAVELDANTRAPRISPDGTRVYLADRAGGVVTVVDTTTDEIRPAVSATPGGGKRGFNVRFTPDGRYAYFVTGGSGDERQVVFLSTVDDTATTLRAIGGRTLVFSPDHSRAYVIDSAGRLVVIDLGTGLADDAEQAPDGDDEASAA